MSKYKKEMCATVIDLMGEGASMHEVSAQIGITYETLKQWSNPKGKYYNKEFAEAVKAGQSAARAWWEKQGRVHLKDRSFNYVGWYMNMKNRFGWRDKQEQTGPDGGPVQHVYLVERISVSPKDKDRDG